MVLDGVYYSAFIQFYRITISRMVESYCIQSSIDLLRSSFDKYCLFLTSTVFS